MGKVEDTSNEGFGVRRIVEFDLALLDRSRRRFRRHVEAKFSIGNASVVNVLTELVHLRVLKVEEVSNEEFGFRGMFN